LHHGRGDFYCDQPLRQPHVYLLVYRCLLHISYPSNLKVLRICLDNKHKTFETCPDELAERMEQKFPSVLTWLFAVSQWHLQAAVRGKSDQKEFS
jgi:hypothetical protein